MSVLISPAAAVSPALQPSVAAARPWQREFQLAQRQAWFHAPYDDVAGQQLAGSRKDALSSRDAVDESPALQLQGQAPSPKVVQGSAGVVRWHGVGPLPAATPSRTCRAAAAAVPSMRTPHTPEASELAGPSMRPDGLVTVAWPHTTLPTSTVARECVASTRTSPTPGPALPVIPKDPFRIHVEEGAHGVVVWLGIDRIAGARPLQPAALALELRRAFAGIGQHLAGVVCNGAAVDDPASNQRQEP